MPKVLSAFLFLIAAGVAAAAPPTLDLPAEVKPASGYARLTPKTDAVSVVYVPLDAAFPFPSAELKNPKSFVLPVAGLKDGRYRFVAVAASKTGEQAEGSFVVVIGSGKADDDKKDDPIPPPKPKPDPPAPEPVTSFHVVIIYESGKTYDAKTAGVLNSGDIRAYLDSVTTPDEGTKGWRMRDKDISADNDTAFQKDMWADVKAKLRPENVPCWAVEVNRKIEIIPLPGSVAEGLATLRKYKGEK